MSSDSRAFWAFEHSGWEKVARPYHDYFRQLTPQVVQPLLDAVRAGPGVRLLDLCTGPGYAAAAAAHRGAKVIGMDFSEAVIRQARREHSGVTFQIGDAEQLPFAAESFDAIVLNFGLLHLGRPEQALADIHRVLCPGGRVAFTVWAKPEESVGFSLILRAIEAHGNLKVPLPEGPPFFRFSDPEECRRVLNEAGFREPTVEKVPQRWRLPSPDALVEAMIEGTVRTGALLKAQLPEALEAIGVAIHRMAAPYERDGYIELPMPALLASAVKG